MEWWWVTMIETTLLHLDSLLGVFTKLSESRISETNAHLVPPLCLYPFFLLCIKCQTTRYTSIGLISDYVMSDNLASLHVHSDTCIIRWCPLFIQYLLQSSVINTEMTKPPKKFMIFYWYDFKINAFSWKLGICKTCIERRFV